MKQKNLFVTTFSPPTFGWPPAFRLAISENITWDRTLLAGGTVSFCLN